MAAATVAFTAGPRANLPVVAARVPITITLSATAYATATGGIPFDLTGILNALGGKGFSPNPVDILSLDGVFYTSGAVTAQHVISGFALGTPTYTAVTGASTQNANLGTLATCPCTVRMYGGAASGVALAEISDANLTGTIVCSVMIAMSGHN